MFKKSTWWLLLLSLLFACGRPETGTDTLFPPLDGLRIGMKKEQALALLPQHAGRFRNTKLFTSLTEISEPTYRDRGLIDLFLFFRPSGKQLILKAAHLVYGYSKSRLARFRRLLEQRFGKGKDWKWKTGDKLYVDLDGRSLRVIKLTFEQR